MKNTLFQGTFQMGSIFKNLLLVRILSATMLMTLQHANLKKDNKNDNRNSLNNAFTDLNERAFY